MRVAQVILPGVSEYERKSQRIDHASLAASHEVIVVTPEEARKSGADVAHVYASGELPSALFVRFPLPYIASADVRRTRWPWRRPTEPDYVVSPIIEKVEQSRYQPLSEAVEERYFVERRPLRAPAAEAAAAPHIIGTFARADVHPIVEQTLARISRFREDVTWHLFDRVPTPDDLASVSVWVDPAVSESDFDGFVAEAAVSGLPIVASRTKINAQRLEQGRTGFLVPPRDPNELAHAILAALFKPEVAGMKVNAARQTASKFRAKQRLRVLVHMYETIAP
jgi:hypothetical protein